MTSVKSWSEKVVAAAFFCLALSGCAAHKAAFHTHPEAAARCQQIKTILIAPPKVKAYEVSAGGGSEQVAEWSDQEVDNVTKSLSERFKAIGITTAVLNTEGANGQELEEVQALFTAVAASIRLHIYQGTPYYFPADEKQFDFSVGSLETLLKPQGGDALLLVYGEDQFATVGKKAVNALGAITGALVGVVPHGEGTYLQMALADRDGNILWYNVKGGRSDLRQPASCNDFVEETLAGFPGLNK